MREMVEIFSARLRKLWNDLELRILVLLSLFLQIVLISTGNRRKYTRRKLIAAILWLSYLSADAVATLSLGVLTQAQSDAESLLDPSYTIMAFWAPFLLMHLGGPDTITAYALADNELWSRHLLGSLTQVIAAIYILLRSWIGDSLNYLWILVLVAGLVKYWERTFVLFLASRDQFRESMVSRPDPGPNYAKLMDELASREGEGYTVSLGKAIGDNTASLSSVLNHPAENSEDAKRIQDGIMLQEAYSFFGTFKKLFADLILSFQDKQDSVLFFRNVTWNKAVSIVEVELGLIYDLFYTKAFVLYSPYGFLLRLISFSSTVAAFVAFLLMIDTNGYPKTEVIITYILLVGAILLEIYAILILISSDMMMVWLSGDSTNLPKLIRNFKDLIVFTICRVVPCLHKLHIVPAKYRWSNAMGQYNVLTYCLKSKPSMKLHPYLEKYKVRHYLEKFLSWNSVSVPKGLKALIFNELRRRVDDKDKRFGSYRGDKMLLQKISYYYDEKDEHKLEFDQSVILWHIATDLCYHTDVDEEETPDETWLSRMSKHLFCRTHIDENEQLEKKWLSEFMIEEESNEEANMKFRRKICRLLSNYMMHLLIMSPFMLPSGIGQIHFHDTCAEVTELFDERKLSRQDACRMLVRVDTRFPPSQVKGDRSKSLLFDACRLAQCLKKLTVGERWKTITQAWVDLLTFAAAQCRWNDHAEKLNQGGELLTHVWLLMAHFGMTDQFQITQGYVRAKLDVK